MLYYAIRLDHVTVLGDDLSSIARAKGGIIKGGVPCLTVEQKEEALVVLHELSQQKLAPLFKSVDPLCLKEFNLGILGDYQKENAALALSLVDAWLSADPHKTKISNNHICKGDYLCYNGVIKDTLAQGTIKLWKLTNIGVLHDLCKAQPPHQSGLPCPGCRRETEIFVSAKKGLEGCYWPGRMQRIIRKSGKVKFFLDGAHTRESIDFFAQWIEKNWSDGKNILVFYCSPERNFNNLVSSLLDLHLNKKFNYIIFCSNIVHNHA
ncbi:folylpolyglutamate synthase, mitochondrial-like, partial [Zophobas morio]|uniref:folylpolyglutamate synthase, mitochondrial-like n=1 Tax=Zophobas morio TaxID=2755281 RepID=UPI003083E12A